MEKISIPLDKGEFILPCAKAAPLACFLCWSRKPQRIGTMLRTMPSGVASERSPGWLALRSPEGMGYLIISAICVYARPGLGHDPVSGTPQGRRIRPTD